MTSCQINQLLGHYPRRIKPVKVVDANQMDRRQIMTTDQI